ncbi:MAG: hypothetical protein KGI38_10005 [Thaumarchaeota archaeon]|nr:hypothetical protein [Nitrososphaerota archaeon]
MKRPKDVIVRLDPACCEWFRNLPPGIIRKKVDAMLDTLQEKPDAGDHVQRSLWPKTGAYQGINNLWRYEIDNEMRASYTLMKEGDSITVRVIEIFQNHKSYEMRFGY